MRWGQGALNFGSRETVYELGVTIPPSSRSRPKVDEPIGRIPQVPASMQAKVVVALASGLAAQPPHSWAGYDGPERTLKIEPSQENRLPYRP
jgi:hypothetical protein